jgi:hypothetical protein
MNKFILSLLLFSAHVILAQSYPPDTVFVKRTIDADKFAIDTLFIPGGVNSAPVLAGTMFLPYSDKMISLLNHGIYPKKLILLEECNGGTNPDLFHDFPKFLATTRVGNELTIDVSVVANCCHSFLGEAEIKGKDTLNLRYISYGDFCACSCCFTLRYTFDTDGEEDYEIMNFVTINGSSEYQELVKQDVTTKQYISKIKKVFDAYIKHDESVDSEENKLKMTNSLKAINQLTNLEELVLLLDVWMYYDPTDYFGKSLIPHILINSSEIGIRAIDYRLSSLHAWENEASAPISDLLALRKQILKEE